MQYYHHHNPSSVTLLSFHPGTSRSSQNKDKLLGLTTQGYAHIPYICDLSGTTTQGLVIVPCPLHQSGLSHSLIPMSCFKTISQSIQPHGYLKTSCTSSFKDFHIYKNIHLYITRKSHSQSTEWYKIPTTSNHSTSRRRL